MRLIFDLTLLDFMNLNSKTEFIFQKLYVYILLLFIVQKISA